MARICTDTTVQREKESSNVAQCYTSQLWWCLDEGAIGDEGMGSAEAADAKNLCNVLGVTGRGTLWK